MSQSNQELLAEITQLQHGLANSQAKIAKLEASLQGNPVAAWVGYQNGEANRDRVRGFEPNNQTVLQYRDKSSAELFHATFEQAAVGVTHNDLKGRWLRVNHRFCAMIGYRKEELLSKTFMEITHQDDVASDVKLIQQMLTGEIQTYTLNKRCFHKNGEIVWVNLTVSLIRDALGMPDYFVVVIEDITKLKLAEQALLQSEERYRRIVEDQSDVICRFQADFEMTFVNQAFSIEFFEGYRLSSAFFQRMLDERKPFIVEDTRSSNEWIHVAAVDWIRSSIGIPIVIRGELLGALGVDSANVGNFRQEDIAKLQDFARYASLALENAYHVSHLEER